MCDRKDRCKHSDNAAKPVCGNQMKPTTLSISKRQLTFKILLNLKQTIKYHTLCRIFSENTNENVTYISQPL